MSGPRDLERVVQSYVPSDDQSSYAVAIGALVTGRPMWPRSEFDPGHFTASGFVLHPSGENVLLIHHAKLDRWLQPGGHFEIEDASVEEAVRREVAEETGIADLDRLGTGLLRIDAHPIPAHGDEPAHTHIDLGIGFRAMSDVIGPLDEVLDARWVPCDELEAYDADEAVRLGVRRLRTFG